MDALRFMDEQKAAGVPLHERVKGLDGVLRSAWPQQRAWQYLCDRCDDTGLVMAVCRRGARCDGISTRTDHRGETPGKYQRLCAKHPESDYEHEYGTPCWCAAGAKFRDKPRPTPDDFKAAGKSKPMTPLGRG